MGVFRNENVTERNFRATQLKGKCSNQWMPPPSLLKGHPLIDGSLGLELDTVSPHPVHKVLTYFFRMVDLNTGVEVGSINLRAGSGPHIERYAGHVGYFVEPAYRGHGYASRALRLLVRIARGLGIDPLWITCDPDNIPSCRTCERAGAKFIEIVDVPEDCVIYQSGHHRKCRYRLDLREIGTTGLNGASRAE